MFSELPQPLQNKVLRYLETDNFKIAKQLHDDWMSQQKNNKNQSIMCKKKGLSLLVWASLLTSSIGVLYDYIQYFVVFDTQET